MIDEKVLSNLKKYNKHEERTCLECGYQGLMGIDKHVTSVYLRIPIKVILFIIGNVLYVFSDRSLLVALGILAIIMPIWTKINKRYVYCPNCEQKLK